MEKRNEFYIETEHIYQAELNADSSIVKGHRMSDKNGIFRSLVDKEHCAEWYVKANTLKLIK